MDFIRKYVPAGVYQRVERYLQGIEFPIGKEQLLSKLQENGAPGLVVNQLGKRLPEGEYSSAGQVLEALRQR